MICRPGRRSMTTFVSGARMGPGNGSTPPSARNCGYRSDLRSGCAWRLMPHDLPPWSTVYDYFRQWRKDGTWERINAALREKLRITLRSEKRLCVAVDAA